MVFFILSTFLKEVKRKKTGIYMRLRKSMSTIITLDKYRAEKKRIRMKMFT